METLISVYATFTSEDEAIGIINKLLAAKLIACANIFPIKSFYVWNDALQQDTECAALLKTIEKNFKNIVAIIEKNHTYQVPCIVKLPLVASQKYNEWVIAQTKISNNYE